MVSAQAGDESDYRQLLKELKAYKSEDKKKGLADLKEFGKKWNSIGYVPKESKAKVEGEFQKLSFSKMKEFGLKAGEIEESSFELKVEGFKEADNAAQLLRNEYGNLNEKLKKVESQIQQYENNLGFFGNASKDNPLVKEVMKNIEASKKEADKIKARIEKLRD